MNVKIFSLSVIAQATGDLSYSPGALQGATVKKGNHCCVQGKNGSCRDKMLQNVD